MESGRLRPSYGHASFQTAEIFLGSSPERCVFTPGIPFHAPEHERSRDPMVTLGK
jgi:hypothetical protein